MRNTQIPDTLSNLLCLLDTFPGQPTVRLTLNASFYIPLRFAMANKIDL
jgi:hypothetical protein